MVDPVLVKGHVVIGNVGNKFNLKIRNQYKLKSARDRLFCSRTLLVEHSEKDLLSDNWLVKIITADLINSTWRIIYTTKLDQVKNMLLYLLFFVTD